jgi:hypothetical protein
MSEPSICKLVMRWSESERMLRLFRVMWNTGTVGDGHGYSTRISVGLQARWFYFTREWSAFRLTILGLHVSARRSYGGRFV